MLLLLRRNHHFLHTTKVQASMCVHVSVSICVLSACYLLGSTCVSGAHSWRPPCCPGCPTPTSHPLHTMQSPACSTPQCSTHPDLAHTHTRTSSFAGSAMTRTATPTPTPLMYPRSQALHTGSEQKVSLRAHTAPLRPTPQTPHTPHSPQHPAFLLAAQPTQPHAIPIPTRSHPCGLHSPVA